MWARIHYLDLTRKNEYFDNSIAAADKTTDKYNRYSHLKEIDKFVYNPLPSGYTLLDYIEAKGDAYIETDVLMSDNITRLEASYTKTNMDDTQILFGACAPGDVDYCYFDYLEACQQYGTLWGKTGLRFGDATYSPGNHIHSSIAINGMEFTYQINEHHISGVMSKKPTENYTYYLFADHSSSGAAIYHTSCYLYGFKIWIDNKLARNYIPCKNPSGTVGLYETILGKFYTHPSLVAGHTTSNTPYEFMLTYHDSLANIPKNYTRLQYITSDGTQYINTGYIPNNNTRLLMTYQ
jgi:hypothetical protein